MQDKKSQIIELQQNMYIAHLERQLLSQIIMTYDKVKKTGAPMKITTNKSAQKRSPRPIESLLYEPSSAKQKETPKLGNPVSVHLSKKGSSRSIRSTAQKTPPKSRSVLGSGAIRSPSHKSFNRSPKSRPGPTHKEW